jgi:3-oxoacyl-[acyl-carrier protein] reductase
MSRIAIVTGGTSDIGVGIIKELLNRGYTVISTYYSTSPELVDDKLVWKNVNLSSKTSLNEFICFIRSSYKSIGIFIHNASRIYRKDFLDMSDDDISEVFETNVLSCYKIIRDLYDMFEEGSKVIVTGSHMGTVPHSVSPIYGMSKASLHALVKNMVKALEPKNITINAVVPGFVETRLQKDKPIEIRNNIYNKTAIHRFANISEIVKGFIFCLDNDFVNGSLIEINGGYNYK